jgi:hypothetical protein
MELLGGASASLVVTEPYYEVLEGWHLQEAINYFYQLKSLKLRGLVADDFRSVPSEARIMGCAIQSEAIYDAYKACGDESGSVCGFDHSLFNQYAARHHENELSIPVWQYRHHEITESFEIAALNYNTLTIENNGVWTTSPFVNISETTTCHGVKVWIEYSLGNTESVITTRSRPYNQGIKLLRKPCHIDSGKAFQYRITVGGDFPNHEVHMIDLKVE